jgi:hypothetical protein
MVLITPVIGTLLQSAISLSSKLKFPENNVVHFPEDLI